MAFDPTKPANGAPIVSAELRDQFNALKALVDAQAAQIASLTQSHNNLQDQVNGLMTPDDISDAINNNAAGPVGSVNLLNMATSSPPTQTQVQAIANRFDEALTLLKRL